ncbi:MBL fold metallo-hydrolase [Mangrovibacterium marinum]|uniref:Glyoxylase-like metal-dependent hydrolase (Beta-lactamase superfamily II) n=1 Tax=Mangrovibacterium marinum TaxID=1639118 RepID=A0A2T5C1C2_9BACT|nr:MBL fold metallo-hydrolase [Mangrovibacterium marinum]PTN08390.1 glyoxylase-like metal-dependent hydrolase (beta-lactamase superfamily II) [Mangrovibacterium marinum]
MIQVKKFTFNPIQENTYLLYDETGECIIVDAGCYFDYEQKELTDFVEQNQLTPVKLVNTHCHLDHIFGVSFCRSKYNIPFLAHQDDAFLVDEIVAHGERFGIPTEPVDGPDGFIDEQDEIQFGNSSLKVIHVPGHAPGHLVLHSPEQNFLLAGDVLFYGSIGRTDLPKGNYEQLISNIQQKLLVLPDETVVYSGHGPETSIGFEKKSNPFLS